MGLLLRLLLLVFPCFNVSLFQVTGQDAPNPAYHADQFMNPNNDARSHRNNFCANRSNFELERSLEGFEIRVGLMEGSSFVNFLYTYARDGKTVLKKQLSAEYPGLVPRLLDELCERSGCTWRNSYYPISTDFPDDKSFADLLLWVTDVYDVAADWWMESIDRLNKGTTFTYEWYDASIIMVTKGEVEAEEQEDRFDCWGWYKPFTTSVWLMIIITIFISAAVYSALERIDPNSDILEEQLTYMETLWMLGTAATGQFEFRPKTNASRLFTVSIAFWALLVISAYTANLAAFLVKRNQSVTIQIHTIQQAINNGKTMCVWKGTQTDSSVLKEYPAFAQTKYYIRTTQEDAYNKVLSGECDIIITEQASWDQFQRDEVYNGDCTLRQTGYTWKRKPASFGVKGDCGQYCTSYLRDVFDYYFLAMKEDGTLDMLWDEQIKSTSTINCAVGLGTVNRRLEDNQSSEIQMYNNVERKENRVLKGSMVKNTGSESVAVASEKSDDSNLESLTLINMGGVFLLHGILMVASFIIALLPWVYHKYSHHNHPKIRYDNKYNGNSQDHKPTGFKPKKARKLKQGSEETEVQMYRTNCDLSTVAPLPDNAATIEQVEELKAELKAELKVCISRLEGISRLEAKLDMLCSHNR